MSRMLRVLLVEDAEDDALLLVRHLSDAKFDVRWRRVDTAADLIAALDDTWDLIFADYSMPSFSGAQALALVRDRGLDLPFIFVSGTIGEDTAVSAMRAGAQDYIMKDKLGRLVPAVERELREAQQRRERGRAERELRLLEGVTRAADRSVDVPAALTAALGEMHEVVQWTEAQLWYPRVDAALLERGGIWRWRNGGVERLRGGRTPEPGEEVSIQAWTSKQPSWSCGVRTNSGADSPSPLANTESTTVVAVPILTDDTVIAVLELWLDEPRDEVPRLTHLLSALATQLGTIIQRKRAEERLYYLAHYDDLTGLPNRSLFADRLQRAIIDATRHGSLVGVLFIDIDRFKSINDSFGHAVGDLLLKGVAERIVRCVRESDTVARLAGDEFTVVLSDMGHMDHAAQVARKILGSFAEPFDVDGHELFVSASIGMTLCPVDENSTDGLLRNADIAMYRAKNDGGNGYQFYSTDMTVNARQRLTLENDLRHALERGELELYYQPIVSVSDGCVGAVEALVRWNHPQRGLLLPGEFIPLAEETGLIVPLGEWVLRSAVHAGARLSRAGFPVLRTAVNISAYQFRQHAFVQMVARLLSEMSLSPSCLQLEITESVLMQDIDSISDALRDLSAMGVELSLDDFGTGYSSLSYVKRFPIDVLKIDRSFVRDIPEDRDDAAIASAIISMAHTLGMEVVAEGVETSSQLDFLRERKCDSVQGYLISPPRPAQEILQCLRDNIEGFPFATHSPEGG